MKWQQNVFWLICQVDKMASWQNDLAPKKCFGRDVKLTKCRGAKKYFG
jgi:hypothetical protein